MKILVACEESQVVCKAFREFGHDVFSCDIQECSGGHPEWHIQGDVLPLLNGFCSFKTQNMSETDEPIWVNAKWDMIIAHPPCTYLSKAGAHLMFPTPGIPDPDRLDKAVKAKDFFMAIYNSHCDKICIENPTPLTICGLPACDQVIQPYWFGEPYSKRTCLWLKGLPPLFGTLIEPDYKSWTSLHSSAKLRSKTFPGIATAMAAQWG